MKHTCNIKIVRKKRISVSIQINLKRKETPDTLVFYTFTFWGTNKTRSRTGNTITLNNKPPGQDALFLKLLIQI